MSLAARNQAPNADGPDAVGFVLAGGRSSRMGADKALVPLAGRPLVDYALHILRQAGLSASIAGARSPLKTFAPVVDDDQPDRGPLGGICAAMASTSVPWVVFLPVDLPLLPVSLVVYLLAHAYITDALATLPSINGVAQTFPAVVSCAALPLLRSELDCGRAGCFSAFHAAAASLGRSVTVLPVELLVQCGKLDHPQGLPPVRWFLNLNAAADIRCAEACLRASLPVI